MIQKLAFTLVGLSIENCPFPFHTHRDTGLKVDESSFVQVELFHNISNKIFIYSMFNNLDLEHSADMELLFTSREKCHLTANTDSALVAGRLWQTSFCHTLQRWNCGLFCSHFHLDRWFKLS